MNHTSPRPMPLRRITSLLLVAVVAICLAGSSGCRLFRGSSQWTIPEEDNARDQLAVALNQQTRARSTFDEDDRSRELRKAIAAFQMVEVRFPTDTQYTPAAIVSMGEIYFSMGEYEAAIEQFERAAISYEDQPDIAIAAVMGLGRSYDKLGRTADAQRAYKRVIDDFSSSQDPKLREQVAEARRRYRVIR